MSLRFRAAGGTVLESTTLPEGWMTINNIPENLLNLRVENLEMRDNVEESDQDI